MRNYELMFIVKTAEESDGTKKIAKAYEKIITDGKGKIAETKDMGQRKLAYPIKKEINGFYYVVDFSANQDTIAELDRRFRIDEKVLRYMIIRLDEE